MEMQPNSNPKFEGGVDMSTTGLTDRSILALTDVLPNVGSLFVRNLMTWPQANAFAERATHGEYQYWTWAQLVGDIFKFSTYLESQGLKAGDRVAFVTTNSYARLVSEMAVMASGLVSVPIFVGYAPEQVRDLVSFAQVKMVVVTDPSKMNGLLPQEIPDKVVALGAPTRELGNNLKDRVQSFSKILETTVVSEVQKAQWVGRFQKVQPQQTCLMMFTSGTSSFPKGVLLSHHNLMSQQRALEVLWKPEPGMRFLCYLPWHHSFGGLFERFFALSSGGCLAVDDSWGKDMDRLFKNFAAIQPHVYFSVPKVYQEIVSRTLKSPELDRVFFNPELKFIFTAAAPLPMSISEVFKSKGVPVVEGWGLTETSPCCTLTERSLSRKPGVVGHAIPGVELKIADDGEIWVRGPNIMSGYYRNAEATESVLTPDGWFKTGDLGELNSDGLKILSRKDRMFKLSNGEKIFPTVIEENVKARCKFVKHAYVFGKGQSNPFLMVFPNTELIQAQDLGDEKKTCECPRDPKAFASCLGECLDQINRDSQVKIERIQKAVIVGAEPTIESQELTPSFKLVPRKVEENYAEIIRAMETHRFGDIHDNAWVVDISDLNKKS